MTNSTLFSHAKAEPVPCFFNSLSSIDSNDIIDPYKFQSALQGGFDRKTGAGLVLKISIQKKPDGITVNRCTHCNHPIPYCPVSEPN
jgi:hypothetical protein